MQIQDVRSAGNVSGVYQSVAGRQGYSTKIAAPAERFADVVSISAAARDRIAADFKAGGTTTASLDTDRGESVLDLDAYFSSKPASPNAEIPPLLMPSQKNIDALTQHINQKFPTFLSENSIPIAPSSIHYDSYGQAQFPEGYPYAAQLKQALKDNPGMERELSTVKALGEFKGLLDQSVPFQKEYSAASSQNELRAVISKYSWLLSENSPSENFALVFDRTGKMRIEKSEGAIS
ncbi:hypothetical protein [Niveibacterium terrae]|uniref:hypothetical protein n=1 Tax=Niveibacterium terrae TaxID=3373598 RepID=UPI003A8D2A48